MRFLMLVLPARYRWRRGRYAPIRRHRPYRMHVYRAAPRSVQALRWGTVAPFPFPLSRRMYNTIAVLMLLGLAVSGSWRRSESPPEQQRQVVVWRHDIAQATALDLEAYVAGVVAAEMPASFHIEALKAQAVLARTYVMRQMTLGFRVPEHPDAVVTTSPARDQAWASQETLKERWGALGYVRNWSRIEEAVAATRGQVLTYGGNPIFPAYHASSGGHTENSENYWSEPLPYLRGVPDRFSTGNRYDRTTVTIPWDTVVRKLGLSAKDVVPVMGPAGRPAIEVRARHPSGRAKTVFVGSRQFTGRQIREALGLDSSWFEVSAVGQDVRFTVHGKGHGVGMSQYGADGMARAGYPYQEILGYYYRGATLSHWD